MFSSRLFQAYVIPVSVYLSMCIAGGYGTGREIVEFFTRHGVYGGLYGLVLATIGIAVVNGLTFELARQIQAYDYRTFIKALIGPFWIVFEGLYVCLFLLVLAIVGAAAGAMIAEHTIVPEKIGLLLVLGVIAILIFHGRELIEKVMVYLAVFLFGAFLLYFAIVFADSWDQIAAQLDSAPAPILGDWLISASKFMLYSSTAAVFALFATRGIVTRTESLLSGGLCGILFMIPATLFHLSFLGAFPEVTTQKVPVHWMISNLDSAILLPVYLLALMGTFLGTGAGFIQALNERLDAWSLEKLSRVLSPRTHSAIAITALLASAGLGQIGVIALIANGYGTLAWGFLVVYVLPVLVVGTYRLFAPKSP